VRKTAVAGCGLVDSWSISVVIMASQGIGSLGPHRRV
jgi:hypothetical protein